MKSAKGLTVIIFACLGLLLLFFQVKQEIILVVIAIVLLAIFLYSREISWGIGRLFRMTLSPFIQKSHPANLMLSQRFEANERAVDKFANAMQLYAQHLVSHTNAIKGLSEASHELRRGAAEQNRATSRLTEILEQQKSGQEVLSVEKAVKDFEGETHQELPAKQELEKGMPIQGLKPKDESLLRLEVQSPPGCAVNPRALLTRTHHWAMNSQVMRR